MKEKLLVTGAAIFVGFHLSKLLIKKAIISSELIT